eukprot:1173717-Rhodomonas_salina.1
MCIRDRSTTVRYRPMCLLWHARYCRREWRCQTTRLRCHVWCSLPGVVGPGIHEQVINAIMKCDPDLIPNLFRNIVVSGGTSLFPGLPERLQKEIKARAAPSSKVTIIAPPGVDLRAQQYAIAIADTDMLDSGTRAAVRSVDRRVCRSFAQEPRGPLDLARRFRRVWPQCRAPPVFLRFDSHRRVVLIRGDAKVPA